MPTVRSVVAGPSRAPVRSREVPDSDAATEDETDGSEDLSQTEDAGLAPRVWPVIKIRDRRDDVIVKVDEYRVRWAPTRHPTALFRISNIQGKPRAKVGDRRWRIVHHTEASPNRQNGEAETIVTWADTWHTMWELSSAFPAIAEFERQNPRPTKQTRMGSKPDLRDWPLFLNAFQDPEPEPELEIDDGDYWIESYNLDIEEGVDYTLSFLRHCKRELQRTGKLGSPSIQTMLCMPLRQRLVFNPAWAESNSAMRSNTQNRRILAAYVVGLARRTPCSHCENSPRERLLFDKCVNWSDAFRDACVNCVFAGSALSSTCDSRPGPITWKSDARQIQQPESHAHAEGAESVFSGDGQYSSVGAHSSSGFKDDEEGDTPPSEQSSPAHGSMGAEEPDSSTRRHADEAATLPTVPAGSRDDDDTNPQGDEHHSSSQTLASSNDQAAPNGSGIRPGLGRLAAMASSNGSELVDEQAAAPNGGGVDSDIDRSEVIAPREESDSHSNAAPQGPVVIPQVIQSTNGRFGPWSPDSASTQAEPSTEGPSNRSSRNLSRRQLAKRPRASDSNAYSSDQEGADLKRTRQTMSEPSGRLEDAANPSTTFKVEPTPSASRPPVEREPEYDVSHHTECSRDPRGRCIDKIVGCRIPAYHKFHPPAGVVYAHENNWESGDLDDDNVRFIISYCPCTKTEYLNDAWQQMLRAKPSNKHVSKYTLLSHRYSDKLNLLIRMYCPSQPQRPGEFIVVD